MFKIGILERIGISCFSVVLIGFIFIALDIFSYKTFIGSSIGSFGYGLLDWLVYKIRN